jgi:hypothetical protein
VGYLKVGARMIELIFGLFEKNYRVLIILMTIFDKEIIIILIRT